MNAPEQITSVSVFSDAGATSLAMMNDGAMMDRMIRFAEIMASGKSTIPQELRNVGDCLAITMQAMAWKMMPQAVAQKTFFIGGKIGYEAQLVAAAISNSGAVKDTFHFDWYGPWEKIIGKFTIKKGDKGEYRVPGWELKDEEGIGVRVWATLRNENEPRVLDLLLAQARTRNSTLWADDPRQQLAYLAQKRWARLYSPGVILGVYTPDELQEPQEREINPMPNSSAAPAGRPEQEDYPQERFDANLPAWEKAIQSGNKTAAEVITMVSKRGRMSDEQKNRINNIARQTPAELMATGQQMAEVRSAAEAAAITWAEVCKAVSVDPDGILTVNQAEAALQFIANPMGE